MARRRRRNEDDGVGGAVLALLVIAAVYWWLRPEYRGRIIAIAVAAAVVLVTVILFVRCWRRQTAKTLMGRLAVAEQMAALSPLEFERACAGLFRELGYRASLTATTGDEGVDIELEKDGERAIVQCKHYQERWVGSPEVRDLLGARQDFRVGNAYLLTSGFFSEPAKALAERNPGLYLWDRDALIKITRQLVWEQLRRKDPAGEVAPVEADPEAVVDEAPVEAEACPRCGRELVCKHGRRGAFMSCSGFPQCRYSRDLTEAEAAE